MKVTFKHFGMFGFGLLTAGFAQAQVAPAPIRPAAPAPAQARPAPARPAQTAPANTNLPAAPAAGEEARVKGIEIQRRPGDLPGPIDSFHDIQDSLKMAFMAADQDHNGQISQKEATDAGNMLVGGLFFTADTNGDGVVSKEEAQAVRQRLLDSNPLMRFALQRAKDPNNKNIAGSEAVKNIGNILDGNDDNNLQATEVRQAVTSAVQGLFAVADTNRDNELSPNEMNAAAYSIARAAAQAAFQQADADNSGGLSKEEFHKGLVKPADAVFNVLDANLDGQLTAEELNRAGRVVANQIRMFEVPDAENSIDELIRTGQRPNEVAPPANINASQVNEKIEAVKPGNNPR